jgi:glycosyltransferase involved in cell wall biosynthesis
MLSVIIPTADSERTLLPTLAALVPGAAAGLVREVIVTDAGSRDATQKIAEAAGCVWHDGGALGARLHAAAATARGPLLLFLRPGFVPDGSWQGEVSRFADRAAGGGKAVAAMFRPSRPLDATQGPMAEALALLWAALMRRARAEQGLLIPQDVYRRIGGHRDTKRPESDLLARLGRRRIALMRCGGVLVVAPSPP